MVTPSLACCAPLRLAVIGSGPSGFYSAARILSTLKPQDGANADVVQVHMYERLPVPCGLVRWGVAPDHLDVKNVENKFAQVAQDPRFSFFGNVNVTADGEGEGEGEGAGEHRVTNTTRGGYTYPHATPLAISTLAQHYTHILLSYGCSQSRLLGIPGSNPGELSNVHSALDFVNWYNGHPAAHDPELLAAEPWRKVDLSGLGQMSVIGAGNVALDVARIVLRASTGGLLGSAASSSAAARQELETSDIPDSVLQHLSESTVSRIDINARRGPAQAAFTNKELREMMALPGIGFEPIDKDLLRKAETDVTRQEEEAKQAAASSAQGGADADVAAHHAGQARVRKRLLSLLDKGSRTRPAEADRVWQLNFFRAPSAFIGIGGSSADAGPRLQKIKWTSTSLGSGGTTALPTPTKAARGNEPTPTTSGAATQPSASQQPTQRVPDSTFETSADIVVSSVGYKGAPLQRTGGDGIASASPSQFRLPWDAAKGIVPNQGGRVVDTSTGTQVPNVYVSGWLARGPVGVIASTMHDAYSVADLILGDFSRASATSTETRGRSAAGTELLQATPPALHGTSKRVVRWEDWLRLDEAERIRGKDKGKEREKVLSVAEMLRIMG